MVNIKEKNDAYIKAKNDTVTLREALLASIEEALEDVECTVAKKLGNNCFIVNSSELVKQESWLPEDVISTINATKFMKFLRSRQDPIPAIVTAAKTGRFVHKGEKYKIHTEVMVVLNKILDQFKVNTDVEPEESSDDTN
ncbi:hypothetical protein HNP86_001803 [Methanococcus maripaludis]|uniref:Uncharacterized protein n=1 Tax=Methanococcus maripaludis TaxID=39152 RepID=A0A7J9NWK6_METMI|nr:hypothetical protein [Methanococcus maripaludis]MBA2851644.1 hypothetical protein [Methanococcus maripaludis]